MKLLFDENISHKLVDALADLYPGSAHPRDIGLKTADDRMIWEYARSHDFTIVSKDSDFYQRSLLFKHPPKVIWLRRGNCATKTVESILRSNFDEIEKFYNNAYESCLILL